MFVKNKIAILCIILFLILTLESAAYIAPPPPANMGKGSTDSGGKPVSSSDRSSGAATSSTGGYSYSSSSSGRSYQTYTYYNNDSIFSVDKCPESKDNEYYLNDDINITVRVICQGTGNLDNVLLKEEVSSGCIIVKNSSKYVIITDPINESINALTREKWRKFDKVDSHSIMAKIPTLNPGNWVKYVYTIRPTKPVWHNLDTIIKFHDYKKGSTLSDFYYSLDRIFVNKMVPLSISLDKDKTHVLPKENVTLVYEIKYAGVNQYELPLEIELNKNMDTYECNNSSKSNVILNKQNSIKFARIINFSKCDEYTAPNLKVNGTPYETNSGNTQIVVESWEERNYDNIYWTFQVLGLIIAFALGFREFMKIESTLHRIGNEIKKIRNLAERYDDYLKNLMSKANDQSK